jgi:hypothetical protein
MASRPKRWEKACSDARKALERMQEIFDGDFASALEELEALKSEYEDWGQSLPENLQGGTVADKLAEIEQLDIDTTKESDFFSTAEELLDAAEGMDLPKGFGRD